MSGQGLRRYFRVEKARGKLATLGLHLFEDNTLCMSRFEKILQLNMLTEQKRRVQSASLMENMRGDNGSFQRKKSASHLKQKSSPPIRRVQKPSNFQGEVSCHTGKHKWPHCPRDGNVTQMRMLSLSITLEAGKSHPLQIQDQVEKTRVPLPIFKQAKRDFKNEF